MSLFHKKQEKQKFDQHHLLCCIKCGGMNMYPQTKITENTVEICIVCKNCQNKSKVFHTYSDAAINWNKLNKR